MALTVFSENATSSGVDGPGAPHLFHRERRRADARDVAGIVALQIHFAYGVRSRESCDLAPASG